MLSSGKTLFFSPPTTPFLYGRGDDEEEEEMDLSTFNSIWEYLIEFYTILSSRCSVSEKKSNEKWLWSWGYFEMEKSFFQRPQNIWAKKECLE